MRDRKKRRRLERKRIARHLNSMAAGNAFGSSQTAGHTLPACRQGGQLDGSQGWSHAAASFAASIAKIGQQKTRGQQLKMLRRHRTGHDTTSDHLMREVGKMDGLSQMTVSHMRAAAGLVSAESHSLAHYGALVGGGLNKIVSHSERLAGDVDEARRRYRRMQKPTDWKRHR